MSALSKRQIRVSTNLQIIDYQFADWYENALLVLACEGLPERYVFAAHNIREILKKLPVLLPNEEIGKWDSSQLHGELNNYLFQPWKQIPNSHGFNPADVIDKPTSKYLRKSREFFTWYESSRHDHANAIFGMIRNLRNKTGNLVEQDLPDTEAAWSKLLKYFTKTCHHGSELDPLDFDENLNEFEELVLGPNYSEQLDLKQELVELVRRLEND